MNHALDTTSLKKHNSLRSKDLNMYIKETGLYNVWRELHAQNRDFTHYSALFLLSNTDKGRVRECLIGTSDISNLNVIYLTIHLNNRPKNTL